MKKSNRYVRIKLIKTDADLLALDCKKRGGTGVSKVKFVLAPMDGMTHAPFRQVCFDYGTDGATTEMISALSYGRVKKKRTAFEETLVRLPGEGNLAAQLIGNTPEDMAAAAKRLTALNRFDAIDINMGCPARKVVGSGNGAAIMRNPKLAAGIMRAVCESTSLPVRLKMRLGWDDHNVTAPEIAQIAQDLGLESITLHGRTRMQMYRGKREYRGYPRYLPKRFHSGLCQWRRGMRAGCVDIFGKHRRIWRLYWPRRPSSNLGYLTIFAA